ncbi:hypothetical protein [Metasolibacillus meyeri]|uniref:hypothetical protein n=1 Tax=Metasolibacillus meyeri TaxID=1071052 RepID=UPI000D31CD6B|nr:hypothetical protein [Metasolibacillus meyeri]
MKKVQVSVHFNGASNYYYFPMDKETFMKQWNNQIAGIGFYSADDEKGCFIVINPTNCGAIEVLEVTA